MSIAAGEHSPVEPADFIALHVLPVLFEFDAMPLVGRAVVTAGEAFHYLARQHLKVGDAMQIAGLEKVADVGHGWCAGRLGTAHRAPRGGPVLLRLFNRSQRAFGFTARHHLENATDDFID